MKLIVLIFVNPESIVNALLCVLERVRTRKIFFLKSLRTSPRVVHVKYYVERANLVLHQ